MTKFREATIEELEAVNPLSLTHTDLEQVLVNLAQSIGSISLKLHELEGDLAVLESKEQYTRYSNVPPKTHGFTDLDRTRESYTCYEYVEYIDTRALTITNISKLKGDLVRHKSLYNAFETIFNRREYAV